MNSFLTEESFVHYRALPEDVRQQARQAYALFRENPHHPSLRFRRVHPTRPIFSARVGIDYRVVGIRDGNDIFWFWIGSHAEYDRLNSDVASGSWVCIAHSTPRPDSSTPQRRPI